VTDEQWGGVEALFTGERVPMSAIADVLGVPVERATELLSNSERASALCARRWLTPLHEALERNPSASAVRRLSDVLVQLARSAGENPVVAQALLVERSRLDDAAEVGDADIRALVPLDEPVARALGELPQRGADGSLLVDTMLLVVATRRRLSPADAAEIVMRLAGVAVQ
jgi:hypothetical protein